MLIPTPARNTINPRITFPQCPGKNIGQLRGSLMLSLLAVALFLGVTASAQTPVVLWAKVNHGVGKTGTNWSNNFGTGIVSDASGNVYTTGRYVNAIDFDPGSGYDTAGAGTPTTDNACFLVKYDSLGNWIWRRTIYKTQGNAIALDDSGNVYHCGKLDGTATFGSGPSAVTLTSTDSSLTSGDMFVAKWNSQGVFQWARAAGGTGIDQANTITVDHSGNVYVGGAYFSSGPVDFDRAHPGTMMLPATSLLDGFLIKYDRNGTPQWVRQIAGSDGDRIDRLAISPASGNIVICGLTSGCTFPPNTTTYTSHGQNDAFMATYTPSGSFIAAKLIGGTDYDYATGLAIDSHGDVYLGGYTYGTIQFDPSVPVTVSAGQIDAYVVKLGEGGTYKWHKSYGGPKYDVVRDLALDDTGNLYVMGVFQDSINLNAAAGRRAFYTSASFQDMFLLKLNTNGNYVWSVPTFSNRYTDPWSIHVDHKANLYAIGAYADSCNFDPGVAAAGVNTIYWQAGMYGQNTFAVKYSHLLHTKSTGIGSTFAPEEVIISPNPVRDILSVRGLLAQKTYWITITDMLGRVQLRRTVSGSAAVSLSLRALPAASYVFSCGDAEGSAVQQAVLVKVGD